MPACDTDGFGRAGSHRHRAYSHVCAATDGIRAFLEREQDAMVIRVERSGWSEYADREPLLLELNLGRILLGVHPPFHELHTSRVVAGCCKYVPLMGTFLDAEQLVAQHRAAGRIRTATVRADDPAIPRYHRHIDLNVLLLGIQYDQPPQAMHTYRSLTVLFTGRESCLCSRALRHFGHIRLPLLSGMYKFIFGNPLMYGRNCGSIQSTSSTSRLLYWSIDRKSRS